MRCGAGRSPSGRNRREVVREVSRKCLEEGKGAHAIARELTEAGVAPPLRADGAWSAAMILRLLHNEKYCGDLLQKKYRTVDHLTHRKVVNRRAEEHSAWKTTTRPLSAGPSLPPSRPSWPGARIGGGEEPLFRPLLVFRQAGVWGVRRAPHRQAHPGVPMRHSCLRLPGTGTGCAMRGRYRETC